MMQHTAPPLAGALCHDSGSARFEYEDNNPTTANAAAVILCQRCPVQTDCLSLYRKYADTLAPSPAITIIAGGYLWRSGRRQAMGEWFREAITHMQRTESLA